MHKEQNKKKNKKTYDRQFRVDMLRSLMVTQIRIDMEMMEQTERKGKEGRKEGGKEGRIKKNNQQQNLCDCV